MKSMTLRLDDEHAESLETIAAVDNTSIVDVIRRAIGAFIETRCSDAEFRRRLRERLSHNARLLKRGKKHAP